MADAATISSLATAGGTLVLAIATFSSVRSANRSARVAERSLLIGLRPVIVPTREEEPVERIRFGDNVFVSVPGHGAAAEEHDGICYLAIGLRNGGQGLAVVHGWRARTDTDSQGPAPDLSDFRRQQLDIYVPAGDDGFWQGALRDRNEPGAPEVRRAIADDEPFQVDLLYGDHEGGQRTVARFVLTVWPEFDGQTSLPGTRRATLLRYFNIDRDDPR